MPLFDGETYDANADKDRLGKNLQAVLGIMADGRWRTLDEILKVLCDDYEIRSTTASASARLRDLRKAKYGSFLVDRRRRGQARAGLFEYRVTTQSMEKPFVLG